MSETYHRTIELELEERKEGAPPTFRAVLSTETPVRRMVRGLLVDEVLRHDEKSVDLSRARPSLPLIIGHDHGALPVGVIEGIRIEGRKLRGMVRFSRSEKAQEVARDVADGIITGVSVGYSIEAFEDKENRDGSVTRTATRWTPHEASAVAIPADATAGFGRGAQKNMSEQTTEQTNVTDPALLERERIATIQTRCRAAHLEDGFADNLIQQGATPEEASRQIVDEMCRRDRMQIKPSGVGWVPQANEFAALRGRSVLGHRQAFDNLRDQQGEIVKDVCRGSLGALELARSVLIHSGEKLPSNNGTLIKRAMSTSDFPLILSSSVGASLRRGYEEEPASHREWVRREPVPDFKKQDRPILGAAPDLRLKLEGGEYQHGSMDEDATSYKVDTYGRIVSLTREVLVNDNLGAWLRQLAAMGQAALRKEADLVYSLFAENGGDGPTMQDTNPLFDTTIHKNQTSSGAFDAALLAAGRLLLRKMKGVGGGILGLRPASLIVPAEHEHQSELLTAAASRVVSSTLEGDVTPWIKELKVVVESRLASSAAFLVADMNQVDAAVLGYLEEGGGAPFFEEKDEFETDNHLFKVRHDFGVKFLDWRGIVKMPIA